MDLLKNKNNNEIQIKEINIKNNNRRKNCLINYYGTKDYLIETINKNINLDKDGKIYDLFTGSMSVAQGLNKTFPKNNIIVNDNNHFLMNFYKVLKSNKKELIDKINELNTVENINNYQDMLNKINNNISYDIEKAAIYYILNKISFKGKIYFGINGKINMQKRNDISILNLKENIFNEFQKFLSIIEINEIDVLENNDYWLNKINKKDIVILDPPYDSLNNKFNQYGSIFNKEKQEELFMFVKKIVEKGSKIIVFNNNTSFIRELYKDFNINIINSYSSLSYSNKSEIMIYN